MTRRQTILHWLGWVALIVALAIILGQQRACADVWGPTFTEHWPGWARGAFFLGPGH